MHFTVFSSIKSEKSAVQYAEFVAHVCCIAFESGVPKGVLLTHGNFLSVIAAALHRYPHVQGPHDRAVGYLPLAHVLELEFELLCLSLGAPIGYGSPLTIIDGAGKLKRGTCTCTCSCSSSSTCTCTWHVCLHLCFKCLY